MSIQRKSGTAWGAVLISLGVLAVVALAYLKSESLWSLLGLIFLAKTWHFGGHLPENCPKCKAGLDIDAGTDWGGTLVSLGILALVAVLLYVSGNLWSLLGLIFLQAAWHNGRLPEKCPSCNEVLVVKRGKKAAKESDDIGIKVK